MIADRCARDSRPVRAIASATTATARVVERLCDECAHSHDGDPHVRVSWIAPHLLPTPNTVAG